MNLSIEAKVAAAVAAAFVGLTAGAIGQSQSSGQPPNEYAPATNPSVNTHMGQRGYNDSSSAGQNDQKFSDENAPSTRQKKNTKHKTATSSKHRTQRTQQNHGTESNGTGY
jgi:hypothetical protein